MKPNQTAPIFIQVAETLKARIQKEEYRPGDLLPSAKVLEDSFGVSNITIRKALEMLGREGWISARRGVGTQVVRVPEEMVEIEITGDFREWAASASGDGRGVEVEILEIGPCEPPARVRELLGLDTNKGVHRLRRVRRIGGQAVSYFINYGPSEVLGRIKAEQLRKSSFVQALEEAGGKPLSGMEQQVRAVTADLDLSVLLEVPFGAPLFFVETVYGRLGRATAVTHMYYRGDKYVYRASIGLK